MVEAFAKVRGLKKAISKMVDFIEEKIDKPEDEVVYVLHADALENAELTAKMIEERVSPKEVRIAEVGPVITCHAGVGVFGVYFKHKG